MFYKYKLNKYLKTIVEPLESEEFTDLFIQSSALGFKTSELGEAEYTILKDVLSKVLVAIENNDFGELIKDLDGYLFPFQANWAKLHLVNNAVVGVTIYNDKSAYKLFLYENTKKVSFKVVYSAGSRTVGVIKERLQLA